MKLVVETRKDMRLMLQSKERTETNLAELIVALGRTTKGNTEPNSDGQRLRDQNRSPVRAGRRRADDHHGNGNPLRRGQPTSGPYRYALVQHGKQLAAGARAIAGFNEWVGKADADYTRVLAELAELKQRIAKLERPETAGD